MKSRVPEFNLSSFLVRYAVAILLVVMALILTLLIWSFIQSLASPLFLLAIMVTAWFSGLKAGLLSAVISSIVINYFFISPEYQISGERDDVFRILIFIMEGAAFSWLISWRTNAAEEIKSSRGQLQALSLRQQTLIEDERKRIALEIHDELGQILTGLKMEIHLLSKKFTGSNSAAEDIDELEAKIKEILQMIDATIVTVRRISTDLRPPILDDLGLVAAIEWQALEFQRRTGIPCVLTTNEIENAKLGSEFSTAVFRIFQETLTNVTRHAEAKNVFVRLEKRDQELLLRVEDDGKGIQPEQTNGNSSLGILGMQERARLISGDLKVFNSDQGGTIVELIAPL